MYDYTEVTLGLHHTHTYTHTHTHTHIYTHTGDNQLPVFLCLDLLELLYGSPEASHCLRFLGPRRGIFF